MCVSLVSQLQWVEWTSLLGEASSVVVGGSGVVRYFVIDCRALLQWALLVRGWGRVMDSSLGDRTLVPFLLRSCLRLVMPVP